jgi:hypothetical protein
MTLHELEGLDEEDEDERDETNLVAFALTSLVVLSSLRTSPHMVSTTI